MWNERYFALAKHISTWSKDPRKQVGAVVTEDNYVRGIGFNGFPRGIEDNAERLLDKDIKLKLMVHAEVNALRAARGEGDTIIIYPCLPCIACLLQIIQAGIIKIVAGPSKPSTAWDPNFVKAIINEARLQLIVMED